MLWLTFEVNLKLFQLVGGGGGNKASSVKLKLELGLSLAIKQNLQSASATKSAVHCWQTNKQTKINTMQL
jgi:hypothetical protein